MHNMSYTQNILMTYTNLHCSNTTNKLENPDPDDSEEEIQTETHEHVPDGQETLHDDTLDLQKQLKKDFTSPRLGQMCFPSLA